MKILIIDDELVSRKKMQKVLDGVGRTMALEGGAQGLAVFAMALAEGKPFDLVTLDVGMPKMDGTEVLFAIRELEKEHGIPREERVKVLMVTAHSDKDTVVTSIQAGCDAYVVKPFDKAAILEKLIQMKLLPA